MARFQQEPNHQLSLLRREHEQLCAQAGSKR
jgi:hypothetical protein